MQKKKKAVEIEDITREEPSVSMGRFQMKVSSKHYLNGHPLCSIEGKPGKDVVQKGDILICPPFIIKSFLDKFTRLDKPELSIEEEAAIEEEAIKPRIEKVGNKQYNVLSADGFKINNDPLTHKQAKELLNIELVELDEGE